MTSPVKTHTDIWRILSPIAPLIGPQEHLRVVRAGHNLTVENRVRDLLIRVHAEDLPSALLEREISICRYLRDVGLHVPEPADLALSQPVRLNDGRRCTIWRLMRGRPGTGTVGDYARLGERLRLLHGVPLPPSHDWDWSPRPRLNRWLDVLETRDPAWIPRGSLPELRRRVTDCLDRIEVLDSAEDLVLCHGDAHPGNLLCSNDGDLLVDFEYAGAGPRDWELSEIRCHERRFGLAGEALRAFASGYGADVSDRGAAAEEFLTLRELMLAAWALYRAVATGGGRQQALVRLASAGDGRSSARWTPL